MRANDDQENNGKVGPKLARTQRREWKRYGNFARIHNKGMTNVFS